MSITPNVPPSAPPSNETYVYEPAPTPRWIPLAVIVLFLGVGALIYIGYNSRTQLQYALTQSNNHADVLSKELEQTNSRVAMLRAQLDVTSQKLGLTQAELARARTMAQQIQQEQQDSDAKLVAQIGQVQQENAAKIGQVSNDLTGAKSDIAATKKDLDETKKNLTTAVGDLNGQGVLIARNHEELEDLRRLNERNIYDFKLTKSSKTPQHVGPIQILLRSTDPKHYKFTMTVIADDKSIEKKDRNVDEPMQLYVHGVRAPYEMVVFEVTKDGANGYLSTPKEAASTAPAGAAVSGGTTGPASTPAVTPPPASAPAAANTPPSGPPRSQQ
jgi:predicted  nucleic acid-binding Zn-ribbon protein